MATEDDGSTTLDIVRGSQFDRKVSERLADNRRLERSGVVSQESINNERQNSQSTIDK